MSCSQMQGDTENLRKRSTTDHFENYSDHDQHHCFLRVGPHHPEVVVTETPSPDPSHHFCHFTPKCVLTVHRGAQSCTSARSTPSLFAEDGWHDGTTRTTIRAENEVEAHRAANNYKFGFRKWKGHVTERPIEDRSDIVRELYCDLKTIKPKEQTGSVVTCGNIVYVFLFGWWISLIYFLICPVMFITICGAPYGKLCWKLTCYFLWPFGKSIQKAIDGERKCSVRFPNCETIPEERESDVLREESTPILISSPVPIQVPGPVPVPVSQPKRSTNYWCRFSTYVWLLLGYPPLAVVHSLAFVLSWLLVFTIPVAKINARTLTTILLMAPEEVHVQQLSAHECDTKVLMCCYHAFNWYYYKYTVQGINVFALNLLPLVGVTLVVGYTDRGNHYSSMEAKFAAAITSIMPLSYFIGMGIASISAQSNFAVGAVVNATFGSITEMTFYITALLQGHRAGTKCLEEIVKSALTGTLLGCILLIPGLCMIIGGIKHREQRFNSRSAGVSSALLFISIGGVFAPTLFSKAYGNLVCEGCTNVPGNASKTFTCKGCHYDTSQADQQFFLTHIEPLVYTISVMLPAAYLIGLIFTLKTHAHIYDIQISNSHGGHEGHPVVHWSRWRAMAVLIVATLLLAACADLTTNNIEPVMSHSSISQYFIGVTVLAMVPELPEIINGIQFALQNNISLSIEVGSCIAVQVCMIQIPLLVLFNAFYDVGFVLVFSDIHLWASIFSVILVNYILMDGKCDYFQGTALVVVYLILLAIYFFAPSPRTC